MKTPKEGQNDQRKNLESPDNRLNLSRRSFMGKAALLGLGLTIFGPSLARADEPRHEDPYYQKIKGDMTAELSGNAEVMPTGERLSESEIETMDKSMHIFFKHYLHIDFWGHLAGKGKKEECEKALLLAMKNPGNLHYKEKNGSIIIQGTIITKEEIDEGGTKVTKDVENPISIEIDGEQIIQINNTEIDYHYVQNFEQQWASILEKIKVITTKIINLRRARSNPEIRKPIISEAERQWYEKYSFELPRRLRDLLVAKSGSALSIDQLTTNNQYGLNDMELMVLKELEKQLANHPNSFEEIGKGKMPQLVVARRIKIEGFQEETPNRVMEIAWMNGERAWRTFARFSIDGFLLNPGDWKQSDTREKPFAETYKEKLKAASATAAVIPATPTP